MQITPFEIVHGFQAPLPSPLAMEEMHFSKMDAENYAVWLRNAIKLLHSAVYKNLEESKAEMKRYYDKYHKVQSEPFVVGDKVLMINKRIPAHSTRVLTRQNYTGPYIIASKAQRHDQIGPAYKLVEMRSGKSVKYLVTPARIKKYNDDRAQFEAVNPPLPQMKADQSTPKGKLINGQTNGQEHKPNSSDDDGFEPAIRINRQRITKGKPEYLVLF